MASRTRVFGLPIGKKKKPSIMPKAIAAGVGLAAVPTIVAARKAGDVISAGKQQAGNVSETVEKAGRLAGAVNRHSSTLGKVGAALNEARKLRGGGGDGAPKLSHLIEEHKDVAVPRSVAYNQWTQFEMFPSIMKGAEQVEQQERDNLKWTSKIGPSRRNWQGEITEQVPDERIAWKSKGGLQLKGVVTFHSLDDDLTRVLVEMEYDPRGAVESVGNLMRVQRRRVRRDLRLFKHFIELRGEETGAWRQRVAKKDDLSNGHGSNGQDENGDDHDNKTSSSPRSQSTGTRKAASRRTSGNASRNASGSTARTTSRNNGTSGSGGSRKSTTPRRQRQDAAS